MGHYGVELKVTNRVRRANVAEDEMVVVPDPNRALRRQVGSAIGVHGCNEAEALLLNNAPHICIERYRLTASLVVTPPSM